MNNLLLDCIYVFLISTILIHVGHLIYDMYEKYKNGEPVFSYKNLFSSKSVEEKNMDIQNDEMTHSINKELEVAALDSENDETNFTESEHETEEKENEDTGGVEKPTENRKDVKQSEKIIKNNSLNSLEELNDIKSNLKQMFNDLNKST